jgi:hypothetical protein
MELLKFLRPGPLTEMPQNTCTRYRSPHRKETAVPVATPSVLPFLYLENNLAFALLHRKVLVDQVCRQFSHHGA